MPGATSSSSHLVLKTRLWQQMIILILQWKELGLREVMKIHQATEMALEPRSTLIHKTFTPGY